MEDDAVSETQTMEKDDAVFILINLCVLEADSRALATGGEWPSGLRHYNHIGRILGQTPWTLGWARRPNLVTRLLVTFG